MAQIPTSPIRVFPQPVTLDTGALSGMSFEEGIGAFSTGAKLPLLMEQIKHEKKRIKMENSKLDFAMSEAGRMQEQEARAAELALLKAKAGLEQQALADATTFVPLENVLPAPATLPLADEIATPVAPPAAPTVKYVPDEATIVREFGDIQQVDDPAAFAQQQINARLSRQFPRGFSVARAQEFDKARTALEETYRPTTTQKTFDDRGVPMMVDVVKVGDQVVQVRPDTMRVDTKKLSDAQKKADAAVAEDLAQAATGTSDRMLQINLQQLDFAADVLRERGALATGGVVSLIPEWLRKRVPGLQEGMAAKDAVRSVVQQTLRQTLGAQFARVEGEMMLDRAFSDAQTPEENLRRLSLLRTELEQYAANKKAAAEYFAANNTLAGFPGMKLDSFADALVKRWKGEVGVEEKPDKAPMVESLTNTYLEGLKNKRG